MTGVQVKQFQVSIMGAMNSAGQPLFPAVGGPKVHLYTNNIVPNPANVIGDFTEAVFAGYPAGGFLITGWNTPLHDPATGDWYMLAQPQPFFTASGVGLPQTVYGYYLTDSFGNLIGGGRFDVPQTLTVAGDTVTLDTEFRAPAFAFPEELEP